MKTHRLGSTDLDITPIGVGAWAMGGGGWQFSWGPQDDADSIAAIHAAVDAGINWIDTAPVYGLGHAEEVVGRAIRGLRNPPLVFTKCGRVWDENRQVGKRLTAASIRAECEASLKRLGTEVIDHYQIHWPEPDVQIEEGWETVVALRREGKVRNIGVSNFSATQMERVRRFGPIGSNQPPYSLIYRDVEAENLPYCQGHDIGVLVYSPMRCGLLSGGMTRARVDALPPDDWRRQHPDFQEPRFSEHLKLVDRLRTVGARHGVSPGAVAIAWTLSHPAVTGAIVGMRRADQVAGVVGAADLRLTDDEKSFLESAR
jgi:aryl-alcohol dehydrogenase-like predicted oxidoreductase